MVGDEFDEVGLGVAECVDGNAGGEVDVPTVFEVVEEGAGAVGEDGDGAGADGVRPDP